MHKINKISVLTLILFSLLFQSCEEEQETDFLNQSTDNELVLKWFSLQTQLVKTTPNTPPPVAARYFAYSGITLYHSLHTAMGVSSLQGKINNLPYLPTENNDRIIWAIVANAAMSEITSLLFENTPATNKAAINNLEAEVLQYYITKNNVVFQQHINESIALGKKIANAVYNFSKTDGGHQAYSNLYPENYNVATGTSFWQPTPPAFLPKPLLPYWGNNRTLLKASEREFVSVNSHPVFSTEINSEFYQKALEVYQVSQQLTQEQSTIAQFWADGGGTFTPPGHMIALSVQLIESENLNLYQATRLMSKVSIGLYDASIICWRIKYDTNLLRPVTYIRNYIDATWSPIITTPPFPSYSSGHSTFSGTTAAILEEEFGTNFTFTDYTKDSYGFASRSFLNFEQMANEAANSRLYGGIHYTFDNTEGLLCGKNIANAIKNLDL